MSPNVPHTTQKHYPTVRKCFAHLSGQGEHDCGYLRAVYSESRLRQSGPAKSSSIRTPRPAPAWIRRDRGKSPIFLNLHIFIGPKKKLIFIWSIFLKSYHFENIFFKVYDVRRPALPPAPIEFETLVFDSEPQNHDLGAGPRSGGGWIQPLARLGPKTEIRISHAATVARCHTLGGST